MLEKIDSPSDLRQLSRRELAPLCREIRDYMVDCCSRNPGHLASSLGAVELTVGLHYVYDTPSDKLVFDVGHQCYAHKIITGRRDSFRRIRTEDGLSGFPSRDESPYDCFGVGHSSTSISAALGFAEAAKLLGETYKTVAVIGDGALTGGLAFEGLNNAGNANADLLVIINDNNQSIDGNLGALHNYLLTLTTNRAYNKLKEKVWEKLGETRARNFFQRWIRSLKSWFVKDSGGDLFESLGFRYFGPVDGNDINQVVDALCKVKNLKGPRVLHCITLKGKGYAPAEADPATWHAPGRFDPSTGERKPSVHPADRYQDVFGQTLLDLAMRDERVVGVTPAMARGCGMSILASGKPESFFDVGIEEEHAVTFSAGLAAAGMVPFCNLYSTFAQRAYDQILHDVALQHLPVVVCLDRAGLVGEDGATHQGAFDISAFRSIPGVIIAAPKDEMELRRLMFTASECGTGPFIIRYPRGCGEGVLWRGTAFEALPVGKGEKLLSGSGIAVIATGPVTNRAVRAAIGCSRAKPSVYYARFVKPLDTDMLEEIALSHGTVVTVEDGAVEGGLFGAVCEYFSFRPEIRVIPVGIPDEFIRQAPVSDQYLRCGLDERSLMTLFESLNG